MVKRAQQPQKVDDAKNAQHQQSQKQVGQSPDRDERSGDSRTRQFGGDHPNDFERQKDKGYGQEPFDEQQYDQEDSGSGSFNEGGAAGQGHGGHHGSSSKGG